MKRPTFLTIALAGLLGSCAETDTRPGSALNIDSQDSSATTPGNAPIENRMGREGSGQYRQKVITH